METATIQLELKTEQEHQIQDNLSEFLATNPGIRNINFVYAHPDDIDGYSGGLVSRLAGINASRSADAKFNFNFVVVTDGANGTKEAINRRQLIDQRQMEQLNSIKTLFNTPEVPEILSENGKDRALLTESNVKVTFLNHPDSNLYEERLVEELASELFTDGTDLIITHDSQSWGKPERFKGTTRSVQNHYDHQSVSKAVSDTIGKLEQSDVENIPVMLRAKWGKTNSDLAVNFNPEAKRRALQAHESQYQQNNAEMDRIIDEMNDVEGEKFEFFEIVNPEIRRQFAFKDRLVELVGHSIQSNIISTEVIHQSFASKNIKKILLLNGMAAEPWQFPGIEVERLDITEGFDPKQLELYTRTNEIDMYVIPFDLPTKARRELDRISKFLSSVNHEGFETIKPHKVKAEAIALKEGKGENLNDYSINIGEW